ncbi:LLM class flavin-dependent oxidoreductase [Chloroflexi bacterium TSY]|nr:LLM class flavin-dependent oxidoreductase [Chloroflexi bacterium TSY]
MTDLKFGWHMHSFPVDGSDGPTFMEQIHTTMQVLHPHFKSVWVDDHMMPWAPWQSNDTPYLECIGTIAYFAGAYPDLQFGASVLCQSYRNPALLAKTVANLQLITGNRVLFGIGAGWMDEEYLAYNWDFPKPSVRIAQMVETIEICQKLWTEAPATYEGNYYRIKDAYCEPRPDPIPSILIGGGGEKLTLRAVAQYADMWNLPGASYEVYTHKLNVLRQHCEAVGRNYNEIVKTWSVEAIALAETEAEAQRIADASPYNKHPVVGTPEQVAEKLQAYVDVGVTYLIVRLIDFPKTDGIELFVEEVMPRLTSSGS